MTQLLLSWGPLGLCIAAALAGSVFPLPSEGVLAALVAVGGEPWSLVAMASVANTVGAASLVILGRKGRPLAVAKFGEERIRLYEARFERYGATLLLLGFLPVVGDLFIVTAGVLGVPWRVIVPLVFLGKAGRYAVVAWGAQQLAGS
jgi:membrane protein YqaA with SNARE-associated domain